MRTFCAIVKTQYTYIRNSIVVVISIAQNLIQIPLEMQSKKLFPPGGEYTIAKRVHCIEPEYL